MLIASFPTSAWQSNCYVVAAAPGKPCVVIDPGPGAAAILTDVLGQHGLSVDAVLLTHGHVDHVGDAAEVADAHGVPVWIHPADEHMLTDPLSGIGLDAGSMLLQLIGSTALPRPRDVRHLADGETLDVAGLTFRQVLAPGHTQGCTLLLTDATGQEGVEQVCFSGDVLFAGSIGRTDLPGGDHAQMITTLAERVATLAPATVVLPGHGPQTSIARELATNPYLRSGGIQ